MNREPKGFVLVLAIMLIGASVVMISLIVNRVSAFRRMGRLSVDSEKARMIALGGIQIAISQLVRLDEDSAEKGENKNEATEQKPDGNQGPREQKESSKEKEKKKRGERAEALVDVLFKYTNKWQTFTFKESVDGVDAECKIYISSEHGKINVNALFDREKKKFVTSGVANAKKLCDFISEKLKPLLEQKKEKKIELSTIIEKFFKEHKSVDDISELFTSNDTDALHLFKRPDDKGIALSDLFTAVTPKNELDPLTFSATLLRLLGLTRTKDPKKLQPEDLIKLTEESKIDWEKMWNPAMVAVYGKEFSTLPAEVKPFFATRFGPTLWSVVSYGKVGSITIRVCAVLEKDKDGLEPFQVIKLYWL